jgi:hypothetical protein
MTGGGCQGLPDHLISDIWYLGTDYLPSYLMKSALQLPLSCGLCALRQPSMASMFGIMLEQSRMTSPEHAARFSASEGPAANPAVADRVTNATTAAIPSTPLRILYMAVSFPFSLTRCMAGTMHPCDVTGKRAVTAVTFLSIAGEFLGGVPPAEVCRISD